MDTFNRNFYHTDGGKFIEMQLFSTKSVDISHSLTFQQKQLYDSIRRRRLFILKIAGETGAVQMNS